MWKRYTKQKILFMGFSLMMIVFIFVTPAFADDGPEGSELRGITWIWEASMFIAAIAALAVVWAWSTGQFKNIEEVTHTMLDLDGDVYEQLEYTEDY